MENGCIIVMRRRGSVITVSGFPFSLFRLESAQPPLPGAIDPEEKSLTPTLETVVQADEADRLRRPLSVALDSHHVRLRLMKVPI